MTAFPVSIRRVEAILEANTQASAKIIRMSSHIDDDDFKGILGRLSIINTRMGLLVSCHDVSELRDLDALIDPQVEANFFSASEEFIHQVNDFVRKVEVVEHGQA
jgi:hypothetical protein